MTEPIIDGVLETSLYVADMARSVKFYTEVLGFESIYSGDRLTAKSVAGGQVLLLFQKGGSTSGPAPHDGCGELHVAFAIARDRLESWEQRLKECGVAIESKCDWPRGGISIYFRDPDRHLVELATPGLWSVY